MVKRNGVFLGTKAGAMVAWLALSMPTVSLAVPPTVTGSLDNRYSDNVTQSAVDEVSDTESRINLSIDHQTDPGRCMASTNAQVGYGTWWDEAYDPELYADAAFFGDCEIRQGLNWELMDSLNQVLQNSRGTDTPDNRTLKNILRTGPRYTMFLGQRDQLSLSAQYQNTEFREPEETDSQRYIGSAAWNHIFDPTLSGGISVSMDRAELDTGGEIDTDVASLNWQKNWAVTQLSASIGYSKLTSRFGSFEQSSDGLVGQVALMRDVTGSLRFFLNASRELTDQTSDFDVRFGEFTFNLRQTSEVEVTALDVGADKSFSSGETLRLVFFANRADYLRVSQKEDSVGIDTVYTRPLGPLWNFDASVRYEYANYDEASENDNTLSVDTRATYSLTRDLSLSGRVGHNRRESDRLANEYEESWVSLGVSYQFR
ncbi:outer membrane beta-barrel protein [Marinobacter nauticus]|uniref:outer membrane beta-barrel protein n=1 Tax=Marinobacter nauticus TaxID=2743 RepID=UPI001CD54612|nr:outer membrane beta-barrel protein [Marinobacter nauticus]MCA0911886.1 outer membrane beta-barrel protein [Marinobacter nauticus]